jgi:hypothetical protein
MNWLMQKIPFLTIKQHCKVMDQFLLNHEATVKQQRQDYLAHLTALEERIDNLIRELTIIQLQQESDGKYVISVLLDGTAFARYSHSRTDIAILAEAVGRHVTQSLMHAYFVEPPPFERSPMPNRKLYRSKEGL